MKEVLKFPPGGAVVKNTPANGGDVGLIPESGRFPGKGNGNHSSILAWRIPQTEEPGGVRIHGLTVQGLTKESDTT